MDQFEFPKGIYRRDEIPIADYLMSLREPLINEFMHGFNSLEEAIKARGTDNLDRRAWGIPLENTSHYIKTLDSESQEYVGDVSSWKSVGFRYERHDPDTAEIPVNIDWTMEESHEYAKLYPTAYNLVKKYEKYCPAANYSVMAPNSVLVRHTGPENRQGKSIRIHIPLIIPEGDIFLEVNGEEVTWSDLFGFNNQLAHSSHNLSPHYRLIFLIDFDREFLGMPLGSVYDERLEKNARPLIRNGKEWHLY
jgi:hypothetical protein